MDGSAMERGGPAPPQRLSLSHVLRQHTRTYCDGLGAVVLFFVWQLLICGLQQLTASIDDFPAAILAMILVAASMILASKFFANLDHLYLAYLRGPTDLINRHMSIGFTVPFTMIMNGPMSSPRNIGIIIAGFVITGVLNTFFVFGIAMVVQSMLMAVRLPRRAVVPCMGRTAMSYPVLAPPTLAPLGLEPPVIPVLRVLSCSSYGTAARPHGQDQDRVASYVSASATVTSGSNNLSTVAQSDGDNAAAAEHEKAPPGEDGRRQRALAALRTRAYGLACFAAAHPVLSVSLAGIPLIGIPVSVSLDNDAALDSFVLFALWTGMLAAQAAVKTAPPGAPTRLRPGVRNVLATLLNAVLWSSLGAIAYLAAKAAARGRALDDALAMFSTSTTLADVIRPAPGSVAPGRPTYMGAGDIASSILSAGIVSWGLKLFECRNQLLSRAGVTTLVVGAMIAVGNIVCGPLVVHCMTLAPPAKVLSFAARSVTLALAGPAMKNLGGDVGLNAAMVVFNGIVFQVAMGLGLYRWAGKKLTQGSDYVVAAVQDLKARRRGVLAGADSDATTDIASRIDSGIGSPVASRRASQSDVDTLHDRSPSAMSTASTASTASSASDNAVAKDATGPAATAHNAGGAVLARAPSYGSPHDAFVGHMRGGGDRAGEAASFFSTTPDSASTVSAGMTIGINAAAMGTAYLYEDGSRAAPYAALSMTVFGVMTVVFTSIQPLAAWVIAAVS